MGQLLLVDECLTPNRQIAMTYSGPDPWGIAKKIADNLKPYFHVSSSKNGRQRINWDDAMDPITFYARWWVMRPKSRFTAFWIEMWVIGNKSKVNNTGEFTLYMEGKTKTEVSGWGILLRPFWLMYSYFYYDRVRRQYIESCRNQILNFRNEIKEHFGLAKTEVPVHGVYA
ncbi:MAG: hypothetical protein KKA90_02850 [Nanoarchaeota archaeon]|nr:hypothetical protein [Nanoarchaeota archaeon]